MTTTELPQQTPKKQTFFLRRWLGELYYAPGTGPSIFRYGMLIFDILAVAFFIYLSVSDHQNPWFRPIEISIGVIVLADFLARYYMAKKKWRYLLQLTTIADLVVLVTLFIPAFVDNYAFLRILRAVRILRSKHIVQELRECCGVGKHNEARIQSFLNLGIFIFITTMIVYELQVRVNPAINSHMDALYFTISTLSTTGYGDIVLTGPYGRFISVLIMVLGVSLFLRLLQTLFRTAKVEKPCPQCGLARHEQDATYCKRCGHIMHIETEGEG